MTAATAIRRAVHADVPRIMAIRHAVIENRLSDPNSVTAADCVAFIDRSEIWVWVEDGMIQGFAAGEPLNGQIFALFVDPKYEGRGIGRNYSTWPVLLFEMPGIASRR